MNIVFVFIKGAFVAKIIFCFPSENECLDGMEPVYIFCIFLRHKHPVIQLAIFCIFEDAILLPL